MTTPHRTADDSTGAGVSKRPDESSRASDSSLARDSSLALQELLTLRTIDADTFAGASNRDTSFSGGKRRFGGELLAQGLRAAQATVADRPVHSLHAYFVRPAPLDGELIYRVRRIRDGRSFCVRSVEAVQVHSGRTLSEAQVVFVLDASFQTVEQGYSHTAAAPQVPGPDTLPSEQQRFDAARAIDPERFAHRPVSAVLPPGPFEVRVVENLWQTTSLPAQMHWWVRLRQPTPDPATNAAIAVFFTDDPIMDAALLPHGGRFSGSLFSTASLDHAMWFHEPITLADWHLFAMDSPVAAGARGLTRGQLFTRDGRLVASVAQEVLLRPERA